MPRRLALASAAFATLLGLASCKTTSPEDGGGGTATRPAVDEPVPPGHIRVGSWNLEGLGPSLEIRIDRRRPEDLAAYIARSGVSVLSLQGVGQTPGTDRRNATLDRVMAALKQSGAGDWDYLLFPTVNPQQSRLTGVAWNKADVKPVGQPFRIPLEGTPVGLDDHPYWDRIPHAVKFAVIRGGRNDFVLVPVHTRTAPVGGAPDDPSHRGHEVQRLALALDAVRGHFGGDRDLVLAGDFNTRFANETGPQILVRGVGGIGGGFRDLNANDAVTYLSGGPSDRIFVPAAQPEFESAQSLRLTRPATPPDLFRSTLSDHLLVSFDLKLTDHDDD